MTEFEASFGKEQSSFLSSWQWLLQWDSASA